MPHVPSDQIFFFLVFVLYYTIHGVFCERPFELLVSVTATVIVLLYCIIEYAMNGHNDGEPTKDLKLVFLFSYIQSSICL